MMGCDPDMQSIDWADRLTMQMDPISDEELSSGASYTEEMMRDLIDRARDISEVTARASTQLPPFCQWVVLNQSRPLYLLKMWE